MLPTIVEVQIIFQIPFFSRASNTLLLIYIIFLRITVKLSSLLLLN